MTSSEDHRVLDTSVLFGRTLHETYGRLGSEGVFDIWWCDELLEELRNVHIRKGTDPRRADSINGYLVDAFPAGEIALDDDLAAQAAGLTKDPKDVFLVQLSLMVSPVTCVTRDKKDFDRMSLRGHGVIVLSPDEDLMALWGNEPTRDALLRAFRAQMRERGLSNAELLAKLDGSDCPNMARTAAPFL